MFSSNSAAEPENTQKVAVVHSVRVWLEQTMTWLYTLVANQPDHLKNHVICNRTKNTDQFPFDDVLCLAQDKPFWTFLNAKSWKIRHWRHGRRLDGLVKQAEAQVLHSHFGNHGWENMEAAKRLGVKHVVTFYGYDASRLPQNEPVWRERYAELFASADLFLAEGPFFGQHLTRLGCPPEKVKVQHLGVDLEKIQFQTRSWQPGKPLKVLIAGSFVEKKGMPYAIEALGRIKERVELDITIIGDDNGQERSQQEKSKILAAISDSGLESQVRLLGYQPYSVLIAEARKNHVFLSPSVTASDGDSEGGAPVTIIEMAASGMPVVSTFHCDIPEVIEDGKTGLLAQERDVEGLADKLNWLCDNPDRWAAMGTAARKHTEAEFDSIGQSKRLAAIYHELARN